MSLTNDASHSLVTDILEFFDSLGIEEDDILGFTDQDEGYRTDVADALIRRGMKKGPLDVVEVAKLMGKSCYFGISNWIEMFYATFTDSEQEALAKFPWDATELYQKWDNFKRVHNSHYVFLGLSSLRDTPITLGNLHYIVETQCSHNRRSLIFEEIDLQIDWLEKQEIDLDTTPKDREWYLVPFGPIDSKQYEQDIPESMAAMVDSGDYTLLTPIEELLKRTLVMITYGNQCTSSDKHVVCQTGSDELVIIPSKRCLQENPDKPDLNRRDALIGLSVKKTLPPPPPQP